MKDKITTIIVLAVALFIILIMHNRIDALENERDGLQSVIAEKQDSIRYHETESGRIKSEKLAAELRYKDMEKAYPEVVKSLKEEFGIEIKNLKAYIKNEFAARGEGVGSTTVNNYYDSTRQKRIWFRDFKMDDHYLNFSVRVFDSIPSPYQYVYRDTAETAIASKKKWFLGDEQLYSSTIFRNPNAKITGTTNILIKNYRDKRWVVSAGGYFDPIFMRGGVSVNFGYSLFKF